MGDLSAIFDFPWAVDVWCAADVEMVGHILINTKPHVRLARWSESGNFDHSALCLYVHVVDGLKVVAAAIVLLPCTTFDLELVVLSPSEVILKFDACPVIV